MPSYSLHSLFLQLKEFLCDLLFLYLFNFSLFKINLIPKLALRFGYLEFSLSLIASLKILCTNIINFIVYTFMSYYNEQKVIFLSVIFIRESYFEKKDEINSCRTHPFDFFVQIPII